MEETPKRPRLAFSYERVANKPTIPATGALGGPSPDAKSVVAHLYVEHASVPTIITHPILEDGGIDLSPEHEEKVARGDATREIQATLVLSPEAAISLGRWLVQHGEAARSRRDAQRGD